MAETETKTKTKKTKTNGFDVSLISFDFTFVSEITKKKFDLTMRYQTFAEIQEWNELDNPDSKMNSYDKQLKMLELLLNVVVKPSQKEFKKWFYKLYEPEITDFITQYGEVKGEARKK